MADTNQMQRTWVYPTVEISQDQRVPRPAVGRRYASELTGFDGSVSGGLQPASGFEHVHTLSGFVASTVDGYDQHDETSVNHGIWPVTFVMKDSSSTAFGFVYRMSRKISASSPTTCDIFLDYYNSECGAWRTVRLVNGDTISYSGVTNSACSESGAITSSTEIEVVTYGMLLYVFVKGRTPYRFYLKKCDDGAYIASGSATCAEGYAGTTSALRAASSTITVGGSITASAPGGTIQSLKIIDGAGVTNEYHSISSGNNGDGTKAKMDFTFDNTAPANDQTITIISTDGTSKTFIAKSTGSNGDLDGSNVVFRRDGVNATAHATAFIAAVGASNGLGSKVTLTQGSGKVTIEQAVTGYAGNSTITKSGSFTTASAPPATFTGGGVGFLQTGSTTSANAYNLEQAIKSSNGHGGDVTVSRASNVLTLTQRRKGTVGNTTVTKTNMSNVTVNSSFTGGTGTYCVDDIYENVSTASNPPGPGPKIPFYDPTETDPYVALSINTDRHDSTHSGWGKISLYDSDPIKTWDLRWQNKTKGYYEEEETTPAFHTILDTNETTGFTGTLDNEVGAFFYIGVANGNTSATGANLSDKYFKLRDSSYTTDSNTEDAYNTASFWFNNSSAYTTAHTNDTHHALPTAAQAVAGPSSIDCAVSETAEDGGCPSMSMISVQNIESASGGSTALANYRILKAIQNSINNATNLNITAVPYLTDATSSSLPASNGAAATALLTIIHAITVSNLNGETIAIIDSRGTSTTFTFDTSVTTETGTTIGLSGISDSDEAGVATRIKNTINNYYATITEGITATTGVDGNNSTVTLTQKVAGAHGNTTLTDNVDNADMTSTNFTGGAGDYFLKVTQDNYGTNGQTTITIDSDLDDDAGVYFLSTNTVHTDNLTTAFAGGGTATGTAGTFERKPTKLKAGNYNYAIQFANSHTKLRSGLSEIANMSAGDFRGYGVKPATAEASSEDITAYETFETPVESLTTTIPSVDQADLYVGVHLQYDSFEWDTAYIYRSVKVEEAGGTFSSSIMHLENIIDLEEHRILGPPNGGRQETEDNATYPTWITNVDVGSDSDVRYRNALYWFELDDQQLVFQDVYTDKTLFDERMPYGGAAISYENTLLVSDVRCGVTTVDQSSSQQFRNVGELRWSSLYEPSPELFPVANYYVPEQSSNPIICFAKTGTNILGFARDKIYHIRKQSTNVGGFMKISEMHEGYGIVNADCAASVGTSVYFITHKGLKSIDSRGQLDDVKGVDYLLLNEWRSDLRSLKVEFDSQMGALFILNANQKEAAIFWFNTGRITRYKDLPFDDVKRGFFPYTLTATGGSASSERDERAFFVQNYPYTGDGSGNIWNASDATFSSTKWYPRIYRYRFERDTTITNSNSGDAINGSNRITTLLYPGDTRFTVKAFAAAGAGVDDNVYIISLYTTSTDQQATGAFRPRPITTNGDLNWVGAYIYILSDPGTSGSVGDKMQVLKVLKEDQGGSDSPAYDQFYVKFDSSGDANALKDGTRIGLSPVYTRFIAHPIITTSATDTPLTQISDFHKVKHIDSVGASLTDISSPVKALAKVEADAISSPYSDDTYTLGVFEGNSTTAVSSSPPKDYNGIQKRGFSSELADGIWVPVGDNYGVQSSVLAPFFSSHCPDVDFRLLSLVADGKIVSSYSSERRDP